MVGNFRTGLGRSDTVQINPCNNVVPVGHSGGTVTMWKLTSKAPLVKMLCHKGPITALAFHSNSHLMATAGMERKIKLWDLRKYDVVQILPGHATGYTMDFSQKGLLATATGSFVQILGDFSGSRDYSRYMGHSIAKGYQIQKVLFRSYEDVLGIGDSMSWSSILIPGSEENPTLISGWLTHLKLVNRETRSKFDPFSTNYPRRQSCSARPNKDRVS
ncbi:hypothetical protein CDL12_25837 [Handroanthus impetiginosus]|uniref:BING4 C-terminal domain-containing protein n=1 Tax=Handroanthus impetiginosus TaxID=429701 RepID=A0A2G9G8P0_9LAMI|nr:hypothetical protein CDL12_25837 [Handroanthus impetiginosus]